MSIASQITRLQNIKTAIRNALVSKGITGASSHDMADFAEDIGDIQVGGNYQSKTASASTSQQIITPDSGYDALSQVTINAARKQSKTSSGLLAGNSVTITPDSGYYGLSSVSVSAATLASQTQATAGESDINRGYTAWVNGVKVTGTGNMAYDSVGLNFRASASESVGTLHVGIPAMGYAYVDIVAIVNASLEIDNGGVKTTYTSSVNNIPLSSSSSIYYTITEGSGYGMKLVSLSLHN